MWAFNEPSGAFTDAAKRCTQQSGGRYRIVFNALSTDADQQRQSLVRRLAAKDSSIDLMGMDVIWTAEFAQAGWAKSWPEPLASQIKQGTLSGALATATYNGQLYAAPANTNSQLLWYRKDLVKQPPTTWDELITQATQQPSARHIEIQGAQYEGVVVWFNALVASAGGSIVDGGRVTLGSPGQTAAQIMSRLARSPAADPSLASDKEDQARIAFESGSAAFEINYPFIYPSAKKQAPQIFSKLAWAPYPRVRADLPAKPPIGGINWGVGTYTKHPQEAFQAAACLRNAENQTEAAVKGGLPPTLSSLYDNPTFVKSYPFATLIRQQVDGGAVRPKTAAYADVSLAIAKAVSPPSAIKVPGFVSKLRGELDNALQSKGLI